MRLTAAHRAPAVCCWPQVARNVPYNGRAADMWSCGVILVMFLFGGTSFVTLAGPQCAAPHAPPRCRAGPLFEYASARDARFVRVAAGGLRGLLRDWSLLDNMSGAAIGASRCVPPAACARRAALIRVAHADLLERLLRVQPHERLTAEQTLAHPWLAE